MQRAAELHRTFVRHLTVGLQTTPSDLGIANPLLATSPDSAIDEFAEIGPSWSVIAQGSGDLGQRLQRMFQTQLSDHLRLLVIGADCPDLPRTAVEQAWQRLDSADVVLGPASDGGYYLLGLRGPWQPWMSHLFREIAWSQADVADTTRQRIADQGRSLFELQTRHDVDTLADLQRLVQRLAADRSTDHLADDDRNQRLLENIAAIVPDQVAAWTSGRQRRSQDNCAQDNLRSSS